MATIRKRGARYQAQVRLGGKPPVSKSFDTQAEAKVWARGIEAKLSQATNLTNHTLAEAIDAYSAARDLRPAEANILTWWRARLGQKRLRLLRREDFVKARLSLMKTPTRKGTPPLPSTINRKLARVSAALTYCIEELEWLDKNPARIRALAEHNERSDEEALLPHAVMERLLDACQDHREGHLYPFVICAMSSGARAGELLALRWKDVNLALGVGYVRNSKNGGKRAIPLRGLASDLLREMKQQRAVIQLDDSDSVFRNASGSAPFHYRKAWMQAKATARIDNYRFHDLRHWAASQMAMSGVTQTEAMRILGHRSAQMTRRYSHLFDAHVAAIGDKLADRL